MRLSKKPWQRSSERGRGEIKCYRRKVGWEEHQTKADSQFTVAAIEIWEEKGILGYENHTGGLRLLMQMLPNFSFIGPKVLPSPRKPLWRLGKFRLKGRQKKKKIKESFNSTFKRTQICSVGYFLRFFTRQASLHPAVKRTPGLSIRFTLSKCLGACVDI